MPIHLNVLKHEVKKKGTMAFYFCKKSYKNVMNEKLLIIETFLMFFLISQEKMTLLSWIISLFMLQMLFEYGNEKIYLEIIEDYPEKDCVKPVKFKFLYKKLNGLSDKNIPKEMYYCEMLQVYGFILYSLLFIGTVFIDKYLAVQCGVAYFSFFFLSNLLSAVILKKKSFVERYKCINRHNVKYVFLPENESRPRKIGTCRIVSESKRRGKTFVNVVILETDEVKYNVLLRKDEVAQAKSYYTLYEICNAFYIE